MNSYHNYVRRCVLLTYRFLIYIADLNHIMLLFDVGLGWVGSVKSWVGLGYRKWTHDNVWYGSGLISPASLMIAGPSIYQH